VEDVSYSGLESIEILGKSYASVKYEVKRRFSPNSLCNRTTSTEYMKLFQPSGISSSSTILEGLFTIHSCSRCTIFGTEKKFFRVNGLCFGWIEYIFYSMLVR